MQALRPLPGGASSLTFAAQVAGGRGDRVVVKMAPPGLPPVRNRDVLRQARILRALARVPQVAVPVIYAEDAGDPPGSPPLFVMEYVEGESYEPLLTTLAPGAARPADEEVEQRAMSAVRMLAALHRQDAARLGLAERTPRLAGAGVRQVGPRPGHVPAQRPGRPPGIRVPPATGAQSAGRGRAGGAARRLAPRQYAVCRAGSPRGHRLGDLVSRRRAHRPGLDDDVGQPGQPGHRHPRRLHARGAAAAGLVRSGRRASGAGPGLGAGPDQVQVSSSGRAAGQERREARRVRASSWSAGAALSRARSSGRWRSCRTEAEGTT